MIIKGKSGKEVKLIIFQGKMHLETNLGKEKIDSVADIVKLKLEDGTYTPAIRFWKENEEKVCMPISEDVKKDVSSWYEFHTSEEALVCNYNFITE